MQGNRLIATACGLIAFGTAMVAGTGDRPPVDGDIVVAWTTQSRPLPLPESSPLDSRFRPDGPPVIVRAPPELSA
jgi:hypothetical protein